jgi:hypothetical protein
MGRVLSGLVMVALGDSLCARPPGPPRTDHRSTVRVVATAPRTGPVVHEIPDKRPTCHPRLMCLYDTCVAPRYRNSETGRQRLTGAEAFELEGMDPRDIDIDGFWPKGGDNKGPESVPIAN